MQKQNTKVVAFLQKTYGILNNPLYTSIITWDSSGNFISILDSLMFQTQILPVFFKHKKLKSFIRQLNLYGFRKVKRSLIKDSFFHPRFKRGDQENLLSIKRRKGFKNNKAQLLQENKNLQEIKSDISQVNKKLDDKQIGQSKQNPNFHLETLQDILDLNNCGQTIPEWIEKPFLSCGNIQQNSNLFEFTFM